MSLLPCHAVTPHATPTQYIRGCDGSLLLAHMCCARLCGCRLWRAYPLTSIEQQSFEGDHSIPLTPPPALKVVCPWLSCFVLESMPIGYGKAFGVFPATVGSRGFLFASGLKFGSRCSSRLPWNEVKWQACFSPFLGQPFDLFDCHLLLAQTYPQEGRRL
jgi:hypothetical protein